VSTLVLRSTVPANVMESGNFWLNSLRKGRSGSVAGSGWRNLPSGVTTGSGFKGSLATTTVVATGEVVEGAEVGAEVGEEKGEEGEEEDEREEGSEEPAVAATAAGAAAFGDGGGIVENFRTLVNNQRRSIFLFFSFLFFFFFISPLFLYFFLLIYLNMKFQNIKAG
jgi:hypothetical protein